MQKSYLLLRNNQQSGPYSLDEVKQLPLQSKDLIWIIGQSTGWRYPEEIDALKTAVSPVKNNLEKKLLKEPEVIGSTTAAKESIPTQASRVYVSMPGKVAESIAMPMALAVSETGIPSFDERVEKMRQRIALASTSQYENKGTDVDVKYSRSLEDIKAEYTDWLHTQKHKPKRKIQKKYIGLAALFIAIVSVSFWAAKRFHTSSTLPLLSQNKTTSLVKDQANTANFTTTSDNIISKDIKPVNAVPKKKPLLNKVQNDKVNEIVSLPRSKQPSSTNPIREKNPTPISSAPIVQPATINLAKQIQVTADYIDKQKQKGIGGLAVTVKNNSAQSFKVIAVDVIYFTDAMKEMDRKTLYFSNVSPGTAITLNAPAHKKAEGAFAQLGLISSESGSLYYVSNK